MSSKNKNKKFDIVVVGGGPIGIAFACGFADTKLKIAIVDKLTKQSMSNPKVDGGNDRIMEVLKIVGLDERAKDKFRTYSLGMKQRLAIGSALLTDPEVLVLDEPTNGLDPQGIAEIRNLINRIAQQGKTIIIASHILDEIEKITDIIGSQRGYSNAYLLPECEEDNISTINDDVGDRDPLFNDAAEIVVTAQQGSASLLQRKMKLGYNRAGRIIDQLEAAGIVGPFEGSKARAVLVKDLMDLKELLDN